MKAMSRKHLLFFLLCLALLAGGWVWRNQETYKIAAIGPFDGINPNGIAILEGIRLGVEEQNQQGGIQGKQVELLVFNDGNDRKTALAAAQAIAERDDILLVIGHQKSSTSLAAERVYKKAGLPALAASAMDSRITKNNDYFFRVISNAAFQGSFIANYISRSLNQTQVSIIYDQGSYGTNLLENFEESARNLGIQINRKWPLDSSKAVEQQLEAILLDIKQNPETGMLVLDIFKEEAAQFLTLLRSSGNNQAFFVVDPFTEAIFKDLAQTKEEQASPGFFTNQGYGITPIMVETATPQAKALREKFLRQRGQEPLWYSYSFHDATKVAMQAMLRAELQGKGHLRRDRQAIREALQSFYSFESGLQGNAGQLYFDALGDGNGSLTTLTFRQGRPVPAFTQYELAGELQNSQAALAPTLQGQQLVIGDKLLQGVQVVFAGVQTNAITQLDLQKKSFLADYLVWFRFQGEFDPSQLVFPNALQPLQLLKPVLETEAGGIKTLAYRVQGEFRAQSQDQLFPFDQVSLPLQFRHASKRRDQLLLIPDQFEFSALGQKTNSTPVRGLPSCWQTIQSLAQDRLTPDPQALVHPLDAPSKAQVYSLFEQQIQIKRTGLWSLVRFALAPLLLLLALGALHGLASLRARGFGLAAVALLAVTLRGLQGGAHPEMSLSYFDVMLAFVLVAALVELVLLVRWSKRDDQARTGPQRLWALLPWLGLTLLLVSQLALQALTGASALGQLLQGSFPL